MMKSVLTGLAGALVAASLAGGAAAAQENCKSLAEIKIVDSSGNVVGSFREVVPSVYTDGYRRLGDTLPSQGVWIKNTPTMLQELVAELGSDADGDGNLTQAEFEQLAINYLITKAGYDRGISADGTALDVKDYCSEDLRGLERGVKDDEQFGPVVVYLQGEEDKGSGGEGGPGGGGGGGGAAGTK